MIKIFDKIFEVFTNTFIDGLYHIKFYGFDNDTGKVLQFQNRMGDKFHFSDHPFQWMWGEKTLHKCYIVYIHDNQIIRVLYNTTDQKHEQPLGPYQITFKFNPNFIHYNVEQIKSWSGWSSKQTMDFVQSKEPILRLLSQQAIDAIPDIEGGYVVTVSVPGDKDYRVTRPDLRNRI